MRSRACSIRKWPAIPKNIALVGAHRDTKLRAPYQDPNWEIWACSKSNWKYPIPRFDVFFELHYQARSGDRPAGGTMVFPAGYLDWLKTLPLVYVRDESLGLPGQVRYPIEDMESLWGPFFINTSSIAHMMALALSKKPEFLQMWGIHQANREEHEYQRLACQHFVMEAWRQGTDVYVPPESEVLTPVRTPW